MSSERITCNLRFCRSDWVRERKAGISGEGLVGTIGSQRAEPPRIGRCGEDSEDFRGASRCHSLPYSMSTPVFRAAVVPNSRDWRYENRYVVLLLFLVSALYLADATRDGYRGCLVNTAKAKRQAARPRRAFAGSLGASWRDLGAQPKARSPISPDLNS